MKSAQQYQNSIFRNLFAGIIIPVVIGLAGMLATASMISHAEKILKKLQSISARSLSREKTFTHFVSYSFYLTSAFFEPERKRSYTELSNKNRVLLKQDLENMTPEDAANFSKNMLDAEKLRVHLKDSAGFFSNLKRFQYLADFLSKELQLSAILERNIDETLNDVVEKKTDLRRLADRCQFALILSLFGSTISALWLLTSYGLLVRKRLVSLKIPGPRASKRSSDELTYLEEKIADAFDELRALEQQRNFLVQMVTHDLRSPIMAACASMQMFENEIADSLTEEDFSHIEKAQSDLRAILDVVTGVLLYESINSNQVILKTALVDIGQLIDEVTSEKITKLGILEHKVDNQCLGVEIVCDSKLMRSALLFWIEWFADNSRPGSTTICRAVSTGPWHVIELLCEKMHIDEERWVEVLQFKTALGPDCGPKSLSHFFFNLTDEIISRHGGIFEAVKTNGENALSVRFSFPVNIEQEMSDPPANLKSDARPAPLKFQSQLIFKGIAIALIPLLIQLSAFFYLSRILTELTALELQIASHVELASTAEILSLKAFQANSFLSFFLATRDPHHRDEAFRATATLKDFVSRRYEQMGTGDRIAQTLHHFAASQSTQIESNLKNERAFNSELLGEVAHTVKSAEEPNQTLERGLSDEHSFLTELQNSGEAKIDRTLKILLTICFLNMLAGLSALAVLQSKYRRRLNQVVENARLSTDTKSSPMRILGGDELAVLDARQHKLRADLAVAQKNRNQMIDVLSGTIYEPLKSALEHIKELNDRTVALEGETAVEVAQMTLLSAESSCNQLVTLCADFLLVSNPSSMPLKLIIQVVELDLLLQRVLTGLNSLAEARAIQLKLIPGGLHVPLDESRFYRVIANLVSNALKFALPQTVVEVRSMQVELNEISNFVVEVSDQGPGIDPSKIDNLFNPFVTGASSASGFGLGLAICKQIVESHNGTISACNQNQGTTFRIEIPVHS